MLRERTPIDLGAYLNHFQLFGVGMPWDWTEVLNKLPIEKREYYESLHYQTQALPPLPTVERKAITVHFMDIDSLFLKAFEESYDTFDRYYFEERLKRLKKQLGDSAVHYLVYFPGANLYFRNKDTDQYCGRFRVVARTYGGDEFFGA